METQLQTFLYWVSFAPTCSSGEKSTWNTFIVTNANDCPNLLSHGATFRMGVLLPNYTEENVVKSCGENVPNFKYSTSTGTSTGTSSNVFQILQDLRLKQYQENHPDSLQNESRTSHTSTHSTTSTTAQLTTSFRTIARDTIGNTVQYNWQLLSELLPEIQLGIQYNRQLLSEPHPLKLRLEEPILSGPHPTPDNRYLMIRHATHIWSAVCMCINPQVRFVSWENC